MAATTLRRAAYYPGCTRRMRLLGRLIRPGCACSMSAAPTVAAAKCCARGPAYGVDIYRPTLAPGTRRATTTGHPGRRAGLAVRDGSFDVVVSLDVVEHFEKPDALRVISEMERVCAGSVVVVTPNGFVPQPGTEDEPWQEHRCGFDVAELEALGYDVADLGGPAVLRGRVRNVPRRTARPGRDRGLRPRRQASPRPRLRTPRGQGPPGVDAETAHVSTSDAQGFRRFLKAAGALAMARRLLPRSCSPARCSHSRCGPRRAWVTDFVWAYFAMLTLTSLLGLGFERLATTVVGEREVGDAPGSRLCSWCAWPRSRLRRSRSGR